ncbi:MAG: hypothetical protein ACE5GJ_12295 [Gemmatimonadota bacterium]
MSLKTARILTWIYILCATLAVTWPGALVASRIEPKVFGLPFSFFWPAAWVAVTVPVLYGLDRVERRYRNGADGEKR